MNIINQNNKCILIQAMSLYDHYDHLLQQSSLTNFMFQIICSSLSYELVLVQLSPISTVIHHFGENDSSDEGNGF